jgi:hypothetical protein
MQSAYAHWIKDRLKGQTVHVVASGPSLKGFDYLPLSPYPTIAVNHSYKCVPWALWTVAGDRKFAEVEDVAAHKSTTLLCRNETLPGVVLFESISWFSLNPHDGLYSKKLSGSLALMSAVHAGASKIYLWGHDLCAPSIDAAHATTGFFNHRMDERLKTDKKYTVERADKNLRVRTKIYDKIAERVKGVEIFNVQVNGFVSSIKCFPIVTPDEALKG